MIIIESNHPLYRNKVEKEIIKEGGGTHFNSASLVARQVATLLASLGRWKVEISICPMLGVQYGRGGRYWVQKACVVVGFRSLVASWDWM